MVRFFATLRMTDDTLRMTDDGMADGQSDRLAIEGKGLAAHGEILRYAQNDRLRSE